MNEKENEQNRITESELVETLQNLNKYREKIAQMKPEDFKPTGEYFQIEGTTFQLKMSPEASRGDLLYVLSYIRDLVKRKLRTLSSEEEDKPKEKNNKAMDKEKVKDYLWNYFFPITSASEEERRGMYRCAIEDGYLLYEDDLYEWERKQQWEEFDRLIDEMIKDYAKSVFEDRKRDFSRCYDEPMFSPQLRWNEKYLTPELESFTPIIAIQDLVDYKYVVCALPDEKVDFMLMQKERTPVVVAQYDSLDEMVRDGWCVGS